MMEIFIGIVIGFYLCRFSAFLGPKLLKVVIQYLFPQWLMED